MNYNLEKMDAETVDKLTSKMVQFHNKENTKPSDEVLQLMANTRDRLNRILKGTVYE